MISQKIVFKSKKDPKILIEIGMLLQKSGEKKQEKQMNRII